MYLKEYTHANLKTPVTVDLSKLFTVYYSDAHKSTILLAIGGAMIPILESKAQVELDCSNLTIKEKTNV